MTPTPHPPHSATTTGRSPSPHAPQPRSPKFQEALDARDALASALSRAGIQLPAMDVRIPWADDSEGEALYALVHLGVCCAPVAHMLAEVILKGIAP